MAPLPANLAARLLNPVQARKPVAPNTAYTMLNPTPVAPNTGYGMLNPGTTQPVASNMAADATKNEQVQAPATAPVVKPIPGIDPFLQAAATQAYQNSLNQVSQGRTSRLQQYGFKADSFDDQGNPIGLGVDPNSMFGSFQQLLQQQAGEAASAEANAAGRGLAGSGLANQNEGGLRYGWGAQDVDLGRGLTTDLGALSARALAARETYNSTLYGGQQDAIRNAIDAGDFTAVTDEPTFTPTTPWSADATLPPDTAMIKRPSVKGNTVLWNNQYMNAQKLAKTLTAAGTSVRTFVQQHPAAAKAIGLKLPPPPKKK